jgi:hypothetical protein
VQSCTIIICKQLTVYTGWNCYLSMLNSQPSGEPEYPPDI